MLAKTLLLLHTLHLVCGLNASDKDLLRRDGKKQSRITLEFGKFWGGKGKGKGGAPGLISFISNLCQSARFSTNQSEGSQRVQQTAGESRVAIRIASTNHSPIQILDYEDWTTHRVVSLQRGQLFSQ